MTINKSIIIKEPSAISSLFLLTIFVLSFLVFANTLTHKFTTWDDDKYITENLIIKEFSTKSIGLIFTQPYYCNYSPIHIFIYCVEYKLFGTKPFGYHFISVLLHCLNSLLVFRFMLFFLKNNWQAFFATLLFALHPLRAEPVAWVSSQKDLLFTFFYLLGLIQYVHYRQKGQFIHLGLTLLFFVFSLLSKSTAVTFPIVLLLLDYFKFEKLNLKLVFIKLPFLLLSVGMAVLTYFTQKAEGGIGEPTLVLLERIPAACFVLVSYFWQHIFPFGLYAFCPYPDKVDGHLPIQYWLYILPMAGLFFYIIKNLIQNKLEVFCLLFFVITHAVTLQIIQVGNALTADRFSYLPSIGFALYLVLIFERLSKMSPFNQNFKLGIGIVWCFVLAFATINQNKIWANNIRLYTSILKKYPNVAIAYNNRAIQKVENGDQEGALLDYNNAIRSDSAYQIAYENRGNLFANLSQFEEAFQDYEKSLQLKPTQKVYQNRATLYLRNKDYKAAICDLNQAIQMDPNYSLAYKNRGLAYILSEQKDLGCADLQKAASLGKEDAPMLIDRFCR